ncbi:MAG: UvrD-helicase domain-containing protein [Clostridia bacterium]|nr:UvrD-helicase domain-containing protein [Clostridia bacterium]
MSNQARETLAGRYLAAKKALFDKKYSFLNEKQREAVYTIHGPLLVLAGAGTGKTTLLVNRIAYILKYGDAYFSDDVPASLDENTVTELEKAAEASVEDIDLLLESFAPRAEERVAPWNVLAITFTNKAANEMKTRLAKLIGPAATDLWCGTFHSMCLRMLRMYADEAGLRPSFTIYDTDDIKKLITECMKQLSVDEKVLSAKQIMNRISMAKNELMTPHDFDAEVGNDHKMQQISSVYTLYQSKLHQANAVDFDDIIMRTVALLRRSERARLNYQNKFRYVLIDEFQDTNRAQFELALLLSGGHNNLMVVGDDDQSIYKFRGATIENILHFDEKVVDTKIIKLEENYRSTSNILNAANSVIRNNFGRRGKELWTKGEEGKKVLVKQFETQNDEAKFIANKIMELMIREKKKYGDFAVLYRTNAQSNALETVFAKSGMPYRVIGGHRFFDRKEVKDILAYLSVVNNPSDNLRLERIINEPKRKIGEATMTAVRRIAEDYGASIFDVMEHASKYPMIAKAQSKFQMFVILIRGLQRMAEKEKLSTVVRAAIEKSGYLDMLRQAEENGEGSERRENVEELISVAIEYEESHVDATLRGFLEEVALVSDIDNYDESSEAVVLMTIHSAKGLEFPVVFLPGMEEGVFPSQQSALIKEELEEERRLAYVALTRAEQRVYALCAKERLLFGKTLYNPKSRFLDEIGEEYKVEEILEQKPKYRTEFGEKTKKFSLSNEFTSKSSLTSEVGKTKKVESFVAGDRVKHYMFGEGTVLSVREMGADVLYEIAFDKAGTKKLMATYAKLLKL